MAKQTFTAGQVLTAAQVNGLQTNDFNLTVSTKTAAYTFVVGDRGTRVVLNDTTARTFTIDDAIFSAGDTIQVHNINTGVLTIAAGAGVTLNGADVLTVAQYQSGTIFFTSASSAIFFPTAKTVSSGAVVQVKNVEFATETTTTSATLVDTGLTLSITPTSASNKILVFYSQNFFNQSAERFSVALLRGATNIHQTQGGGQLAQVVHHANAQFLDSPATTSATTYKMQMRKENAGGSTLVAQFNATQTGKSTMTLMEVTP